uniref:Beta-glucuronidase C-terminal domain-containing protein n=1 Tax=Arion vulgaris TaxID=1028688 RepID=A0A0B7BB74_9EUPU
MNNMLKMLLQCLLLQTLVIYCCTAQVPSNTNVLESKVVSRPNPKPTTYKISVNLTSSLAATDVRFLSVATDNARVATKWKSSKKFENFASALSPCDFRLGGDSSNMVIFNPSQRVTRQSSFPGNLDSHKDIKMTGKQWELIMKFIKNVGWDLMYDFNQFIRKDGLWDPTNAELLLNYSSARGIRIPYFELGNEPNAYKGNYDFVIDPPTLAKDFQILKTLISKYPLYASSKLYGPDVTSLEIRSDARKYFLDFVAEIPYDVIDELSFHHYFGDGRTATAPDYLNATLLESLKNTLQMVLQTSRTSSLPLRARLTETYSFYSGGTPGLSDRYISGFQWLDKLGLSAQFGLTRVFRQSIIGGSYALINFRGDPTPDYYLSLLFKRLVEGPVFDVSIDVLNQNVRVYAHCARRGTYSPGALVIYYVNLDNAKAVLSVGQFKNANLDLFLLTPGDKEGLTSKFVKLNGKKLPMKGPTVPPLLPKPFKGKVTVTAQSFGFIVVPEANVKLCVDYFANLNSQ